MTFNVQRVTRIIEMRRYGSLNVRTGDEQIQFLNMGLERVAFGGDGVVFKVCERLLKAGLVITFAIQERVALLLSGVPKQISNVAVFSPQVGEATKLSVVTNCGCQEDAVDPPGRSSTDDVNHDVGIGQRLDERKDAAATYRPEELVGHAVDVDGQRNPAIQHEAKTVFVGEFQVGRARCRHNRFSSALIKSVMRITMGHFTVNPPNRQGLSSGMALQRRAPPSWSCSALPGSAGFGPRTTAGIRYRRLTRPSHDKTVGAGHCARPERFLRGWSRDRMGRGVTLTPGRETAVRPWIDNVRSTPAIQTLVRKAG